MKRTKTLRAFLMAQPRVVGDKLLADAAERALDKLLAALPQTLRRRAATMRQRLHVDTTAWYGRVEDLSRLPIVQDALSRDRKLLINYVRGTRGSRREEEQPGERTVDPLGLVRGVEEAEELTDVARWRRGWVKRCAGARRPGLTRVGNAVACDHAGRRLAVQSRLGGRRLTGRQRGPVPFARAISAFANRLPRRDGVWDGDLRRGAHLVTLGRGSRRSAIRCDRAARRA